MLHLLFYGHGRRAIIDISYEFLLNHFELIIHIPRYTGVLLDQGIMLETLEIWQDVFLVLPHHSQNNFGTLLEDAFFSQYAHRVHYIWSEPEWDDLWSIQLCALLKNITEVDMSYFSRKLMHQYIVAVSVTKADDVADHGP